MNIALRSGLMAAAAIGVLASAVPSTEAQIMLASVSQVAERQGPTLTAFRQGVNDAKDRRDLAISVLDIDVTVRGSIAETVVSATFTNPGTDILEGRFVMDMAPGSAVTGYALDVNGQMIDGVLESRYKAAEAYQTRVNRRIDPGLVEVDHSDRFETRIYPINPKGQRTIRLKMVSTFDPKNGYVLPLTIAQPVGSLTLDVNGVAQVMRVPSGLKTQDSNEARNISLKGELRLAADQRPAVMVSRHPGTETFFDIVGSLPRGESARKKPLHILWDRSVSRIDDELKEEAQLAEDIALKRGLRRATITFFDSGKPETRDVMADRISEALRDVHYRGGTSYPTLAGLAIAPGSDCLMFSDGRASIDDRKDFLPACSVTTVTSGPERDAAWLSDVAQRTGGAMHTLTRKNAEDVFKLLDRPDAGIVSVTDGKGVAVAFASLATDRRAFNIVGPVPNDGVVLVSVEGEAQPRRFDVSDRGERFAGPGALWARHRLGVIETETKPDDLAAMARRYNVATPQASFIVLESPADYVQSKIAPPESYPKELRIAYGNLRDNADRAQRDGKERRLTEVVSLWEQQKAWWERKFDGEDSREFAKPSPSGAVGSAAPPPAPSAPPPAQMQRAAEGNDRDVVVVTGSRIAGSAEDAALPVEVFTSEEKDTAAPSRGGSISVAEWKIDRPYLARLDKAGNEWERALDQEMKSHGALPVFWFDVAEWHWQKGRKEEARRAVESALDLPTRDNQTLAIVAARLLRYGSHDRAVWLLSRLEEREPTRPQPKRSLALALLERANVAATPDLARKDLGDAVALLASAATDVYERPARGLENVALMEANAALARLKRMGGSSDALDPRLVALLDADLRVVVEWNTPRTDLDLWVGEPKGYSVGYSSPLSPWGGKLSGDVTDGYGPEEYVIRRAVSGEYLVSANTFASDPSNPNGPSTIAVRLIRNFGRPGQTEELMDVALEAQDKTKEELGRIRIE
jgi:hypothetical protein